MRTRKWTPGFPANPGYYLVSYTANQYGKREVELLRIYKDSLDRPLYKLGGRLVTLKSILRCQPSYSVVEVGNPPSVSFIAR